MPAITALRVRCTIYTIVTSNKNVFILAEESIEGADISGTEAPLPREDCIGDNGDEDNEPSTLPSTPVNSNEGI